MRDRETRRHTGLVTRALLSLAVLATAVTIAACSDSSGPSARRLSGRWVVDSADGSALPYTVRFNLNSTYDLVQGEIRFSGATGTDSLRFSAHDFGGNALGDTVVRRDIVDYTVRNDSIFIDRFRTPVSYVDTGVVLADTLIVRAQRIDPQATETVVLRYRRVP